MRLQENERRFRKANDALELATKRMGARGEIPFLCECSDGGCLETVLLAPEDYHGLRGVPNRFVVVPGHQTPGVDVVVGELAGYTLVEKERAESAA